MSSAPHLPRGKWPSSASRWAVYVAFVLSGVSGLVYEVVWSRYLALYVGHSAYAQILVLAVYLGGMAVGGLAVGDLSRRLSRPLRAYAAAEGLLAVFGLLFHGLFLLLTRASYDTIFPALANASLVGGVRWGLATLLVFPQAVVLGATFPLMAAGLVRRDRDRPGRGVATAYLANTFGGAFGVLLAGFAFIPLVGLPGTLGIAATLNAVAAGLVFLVTRGPALAPVAAEPAAPPTGATVAAGLSGTTLWRWMLVVSFGTALASFAYEIGWIRMLSLVLGSATHAFEIMLSAFILGLAIGSLLIRRAADRAPAPVRLLGWLQWGMGLAALATLPFYAGTFDTMAGLVTTLPERESGYLLFNLWRYGLCLLIMLPATVLAGTTLPLITATLLRRGHGERSIGWVYGLNTLGSVTGAAIAGLVALPLLGLKGLLVAGATLDMALGVALLHGAFKGGRRGVAPAMALGTVAVAAAVFAGVGLDQAVLTSGVFRFGSVPKPGSREILYYQDGRTASVGVFLKRANGVVVLTTNGKPDASLDPRWFDPGRDTVPPTPLLAAGDATTQLLAPLIGLAHRPDARNVANIGHGSGMSGQALLSSPALERLVTIEIEPAMVEGSLAFLPSNGRVFQDPRSTFVFDDAKSFFAYRDERFDLIFSEPSNPWVSGIASLFSEEFYRDIRRYLSRGGILAQWIQLYEIDDPLVLSIIAALDASFPSYRAYLIGDADMVILASTADSLPTPDWSVMDLPGVRETLVDVPPFRPQHLEPLLLFDETTLRPLLDQGVRANSDFLPVLEAGTERARFEDRWADGIYSLAVHRVDLRRALSRERLVPPDSFALVPAYGLEPTVNRGLSTWLHLATRAGGAQAPDAFPGWGAALLDLRDYLEEAQGSSEPSGWLAWAQKFGRIEQSLHLGTAGWVDEGFYQATYRYLEAQAAPVEARASVDLLHGVGSWNFEQASAAADVLLEAVRRSEWWVRPAILLDASVLAYLQSGRTSDARLALDLVGPTVGRGEDNLRNRLLERLIDTSEPGRGPITP